MTARHAHLRDRLRDRLAGSNGWEIAEDRHDADAAMESVFAVGNGYLGIRGTPEEGGPAHDAGAILNGFHETWPIEYPEDAYGLARTGQTIVSATDGSVIRLFVDDEPIDLATTRVIRFERVLDMRTGVLRREVEFALRDGRRLLVRSRRLASLADRHLAAFDYEVVALDGGVRIAISSELVTHGAPGRRRRSAARQGLRREGARADRRPRVDRRAVLWLRTRNSGLELGVRDGPRHRGPVAGRPSRRRAVGDGAQVVVQAELGAGEALRLRKYVAYHWAAEAPPATSPRAPRGRSTARAERL